MERLWLVTLDTARLRRLMYGARNRRATRAVEPAAAAAGSRLIAACVLPYGLRAIIAARSRGTVRHFIRRFAALTADLGDRAPPWRSSARIRPVASRQLDRYLECLRRWKATKLEDQPTVPPSHRPKATRLRRAAAMLRTIDHCNDSALGADESAARIRRYAAEHDAPPDDNAAFERLCTVVFAQGLSFEAVGARREALREAFEGFDPRRIARFNDKSIRAILAAPIIRNETKVRACVDNAKRWIRAAAAEGSYLARVAKQASDDEAAAGWPKLAGTLRADFVRLGDVAARQTLKRWGFFTAFAHPGAQRVLQRLGLLDDDLEPAAVQRFIGSVAQSTGRDPYVVEAALALFAGAGPCRPKPACDRCPLADRCPTGSAIQA